MSLPLLPKKLGAHPQCEKVKLNSYGVPESPEAQQSMDEMGGKCEHTVRSKALEH